MQRNKKEKEVGRETVKGKKKFVVKSPHRATHGEKNRAPTEKNWKK